MPNRFTPLKSPKLERTPAPQRSCARLLSGPSCNKIPLQTLLCGALSCGAASVSAQPLFAQFINAQAIVAVQQPSLPYTSVVPDYIELPPPDAAGFERNYDLTRAQDFTDETEMVVIPVDRYSVGTVDPQSVYEEMERGLDDEQMVVVWPEADTENALPPPTVVPVDSYGQYAVNVIPADPYQAPYYYPEDDVFHRINNSGPYAAGIDGGRMAQQPIPGSDDAPAYPARGRDRDSQAPEARGRGRMILPPGSTPTQ